MGEVVQEIMEELGFGIVPNVFARAQSPDLQMALWKSFRHVVLRGVLPRTVKEMMGVLVSRANGSRYAAEVHLHALMVQGTEAHLLESLQQGQVPPGLPGKVQALLTFAHLAATAPNPALVEGLRQAGLSETEVQEAVAVVGLFALVNTWTDLQEIPIDPL
jgi:AhpD family alkylhydroperoxidase